MMTSEKVQIIDDEKNDFGSPYNGNIDSQNGTNNVLKKILLENSNSLNNNQ